MQGCGKSVITKRTSLISSGGSWDGGNLFNAVGENVTIQDAMGISYKGKKQLSIWATAKRGLWEEMGINYQHCNNDHLIIHAFTWDKRILDYKFFGYHILSISRTNIRCLWENAPDRHENSELVFFDCYNHKQCMNIINDIVSNNDKWSSECAFNTIRTFLHYGKISLKDLEVSLRI